MTKVASLSTISMSHMQDNDIVEIDNNIGHCASFLSFLKRRAVADIIVYFYRYYILAYDSARIKLARLARIKLSCILIDFKNLLLILFV